jgi:hypothetical protein
MIRRTAKVLFAITITSAALISSAGNKSLSDDQFLDMVSHACFKFFWKEAAPETGLSRDNTKFPQVYSVAATGFGLSAMVIGAERGYRPRAEIKKRVYAMLKALNRSPKKNGMLFHFLDKNANLSLDGYEKVTSTIDTGLLLMGAITAGEYFGGKIKEEAEKLYYNVNWNAYVESKRRLIKMAWQPNDKHKPTGEGFFHSATWDYYSDESIIVTLLAISAPNKKYRVPADFFYRWIRKSGQYKPVTPGLKPAGPYVYSWTGALFTYQFAHMWIDFRILSKDNPKKFGLNHVPAVNWFQNTLNATIVSRQFCIDRRKKFKSFGHNSWGLTACAAKNGYYVGGFAPRGDQAPPVLNGTIAPYGAGSAIMFLPKESIAALRYYHRLKATNGKPLVWDDPSGSGYGFHDSFNLDTDFVAKEYLGIDQGPLLLAIENYRSGLLHKTFMKNRHIREGLTRIGFQFK